MRGMRFSDCIWLVEIVFFWLQCLVPSIDVYASLAALQFNHQMCTYA
jgi:hypothetical protein